MSSLPPKEAVLLCLNMLMHERLTKVQLAERLGVTDRSVKRYMRDIRESGFRIRSMFRENPSIGSQDVYVYWIDPLLPRPVADIPL